MSSENGSFHERGLETKNLTGFYWNLLETTGNHRNLKEMSERVEFHAKLATRGRVHIPKNMLGFPRICLLSLPENLDLVHGCEVLEAYFGEFKPPLNISPRP